MDSVFGYDSPGINGEKLFGLCLSTNDGEAEHDHLSILELPSEIPLALLVYQYPYVRFKLILAVENQLFKFGLVAFTNPFQKLCQGEPAVEFNILFMFAGHVVIDV